MWLLNELNASEVRQKDLCGVVINYRITMTSMQLPLIQRVYPNLYLTLWPCTKSSTVALIVTRPRVLQVTESWVAVTYAKLGENETTTMKFIFCPKDVCSYVAVS